MASKSKQSVGAERLRSFSARWEEALKGLGVHTGPDDRPASTGDMAKQVDELMRQLMATYQVKSVGMLMRELSREAEVEAEKPSLPDLKQTGVLDLVTASLDRVSKAEQAAYEARKDALDAKLQERKAERESEISLIKDVLIPVLTQKQQEPTNQGLDLNRLLVGDGKSPSPLLGFLAELVKERLTPADPIQTTQASLALVRGLRESLADLFPKSEDRTLERELEHRRLDLKLQEIQYEHERWRFDMERQAQQEEARLRRQEQLVGQIAQLLPMAVAAFTGHIPAAPSEGEQAAEMAAEPEAEPGIGPTNGHPSMNGHIHADYAAQEGYLDHGEAS